MTDKRICPIGIPQHIIQRGNNKQACFITDKDRKAYLYWVKKYSKQYLVDIHSWVLMDNHVHLLCTPQAEYAIAKMMQSLGRMYVQNFNFKHQRTGGLWEGRYKSCLIDSKNYLLCVHRYIELNPVRACMVNHPSKYSWSSFAHNAFGEKSNICTQHDEYIALGKDKKTRQYNYLQLFEQKEPLYEIHQIRQTINSNKNLGSVAFIEKIEKGLY